MSLIGDVRELLDDAGVFFTDALVYARANDAQLWVWGEVRHRIYKTVILMPTDEELIDLPPEMMIPQRIYSKDGPMDVVTWMDLERESRAWRQWTQRQPRFAVIFDATRLLIAPRPERNRWTYVEGVKYPQVVLASGTDDLAGEPRPVVDAVKFETAARCAVATRPDLYGTFHELALAEIAQMRTRNRVPFGRMRMKGPQVRKPFDFRHTNPYA